MLDTQMTTLSILVPTFNEADNISDIISQIIVSLENNLAIGYEILIIDDDSPDGTAAIAEKALRSRGRVIVRKNKDRSLSLSVLDGIYQAKGEYIVVMDADGSHPPELIPALLGEVKNGFDLAVASRYVNGGGSNFPFSRKLMSRIACLIGTLVTGIKDNTSGFFCIRRHCLEGVTLTPQGFKIGTEIFVKAKIKSFKEVPYIFQNRRRGESKLNNTLVLQYLSQILSLLIYKFKKR